MYQYQPDDYEPQVGDVCQDDSGKLFIVTHIFTKNGTHNIGFKPQHSYPPCLVRTIVTKPGLEAHPGDTIMCVKDSHLTSCELGQTYIAQGVAYGKGFIYWGSEHPDWCTHTNEFVVLCKAEPHQFQVGDLVRYLGESIHGSEIEHGQTFTVKEVSSTDLFYRDGFAKPIYQCELVTPAESKPNTTKEQPMNTLNLQFLLEMMAQQPIDATNADYIGILTEPDGSYVGYVYANQKAELGEVMRKPENESRKLHVFNYAETIAQKPRKIVSVERV